MSWDFDFEDAPPALALRLARDLGLELIMIWTTEPSDLIDAGGFKLETAEDYRKAAVQLMQVAENWDAIDSEWEEVWEDE